MTNLRFTNEEIDKLIEKATPKELRYFRTISDGWAWAFANEDYPGDRYVYKCPNCNEEYTYWSNPKGSKYSFYCSNCGQKLEGEYQ